MTADNSMLSASVGAHSAAVSEHAVLSCVRRLGARRENKRASIQMPNLRYSTSARSGARLAPPLNYGDDGHGLLVLLVGLYLLLLLRGCRPRFRKGGVPALLALRVARLQVDFIRTRSVVLREPAIVRDKRGDRALVGYAVENGGLLAVVRRTRHGFPATPLASPQVWNGT